jgi:hypothetical protein
MPLVLTPCLPELLLPAVLLPPVAAASKILAAAVVRLALVPAVALAAAAVLTVVTQMILQLSNASTSAARELPCTTGIGYTCSNSATGMS